MRRRIEATRWPEKETVADTSQGVPLAPLQDLARYWATDYDWRKCEAKLNALPQFITEIDGLDIHFIHVRSKHKGALPVIVTHGWPGSILEQIKLVGPLTDPTAFGGRAEDAFDVVIRRSPVMGSRASRRRPAGIMPYRARFDRADEAPGIHAIRRAGRRRRRTGHGRHGGRGARGARGDAHQLPVRPPGGRLERDPVRRTAAVRSSDLERRAFGKLKGFFIKNAAYAIEMATRPQTLYGLADSPVALAAWLIDHGDGDDQPAATVLEAMRTPTKGQPRSG